MRAASTIPVESFNLSMWLLAGEEGTVSSASIRIRAVSLIPTLTAA
jgi:hypothetical protein